MCVFVCVCVPVLLDGRGAQWAGVCAAVSDGVGGRGGLREDPFPWYGYRFVDSRQHWSWFWLRGHKNRGVPSLRPSLDKTSTGLKRVELLNQKQAENFRKDFLYLPFQ